MTYSYRIHIDPFFAILLIFVSFIDSPSTSKLFFSQCQ